MQCCFLFRIRYAKLYISLIMKNLLAILLILSFWLTGCKKEDVDYPPPSINLISEVGFVSTDTVMSLGEMFKVGIDAANPNVNLTNFIIKVESDEIETFLDSGMNTPTMHYESYITKGIKDSEKWIFIIRDKDGKSAETSIVVNKDTSSAYGSISYYESAELGAQDNDKASFFSLEEGSSYSLSDAYNNQKAIDLCYYYDFIDTDENTIASPGANIDESIYPGDYGLSNWTTRRTSRFKVADITEEDFDNAVNDSLLIATYGQSDGNRKAKNLQTGSIFAFKNEDGKVGLFKVNSIFGTDQGMVVVSIKVQE